MDKARKKSRWRWLWLAAGTLMLLLAALIMLAPTILVSIRYPELKVDLSPFLGEKLSNLFSNKTATATFSLGRSGSGGYDVRAGGTLLDWPFSMQAHVMPTFRFLGVDAAGTVDFWLADTEWSLRADFEASSSGAWRADVEIPDTAVDENDPVMGGILSRLPMPAISNLVFGGTFGLKANGERSKELPVTKWTAAMQFKGFNVSCFAGRMPVEIKNMRMSAGASGIAKHTDIRPMFPRADSITVSGCVLSNAFASIRATETAYLVTEAGADCCGGELKMYSFFLDPKKLNAGVTLFVDGVDAGEVLKHIKGFRGEASGRMHGKLPLYLKNGNELKLRNAYLYSEPGETGMLRVFDPEPVVENLALGGISEGVRGNVAKALANLDYSVLKLSLKPDDSGDLALTVKIAGSATHAGKTVPVSFEVTFHGDVEQLINTGLKTVTRK